MENIKETKYDNVIVFETKDYQWGVKDADGKVIVPVGKYGWIDGFDHGLARVHTHGKFRGSRETVFMNNPETGELVSDKQKMAEIEAKDRKLHPDHYAKWGIINEKGEEVLPLEYDSIWNFLNKGRLSTKVVKHGHEEEVFFHDLNSDISLPAWERHNRYHEDSYGGEEPYGSHYGEYAGSYAQDVMGYSDEVIDDAFDGDPDAYWNID